MEGWPIDRGQVLHSTLLYISYSDELAIHDGVIFRGKRIVVPISLRKGKKEKVHVGINSFLRRERYLIFLLI